MKKKREKYKYLHIFRYNEIKFYDRLIKMLHDDNRFNLEDHYFVTPFQEVTEYFKNITPNIMLIKPRGKHWIAHSINKYAPYCKWIFLHSMENGIGALLINHKYYHKIIWRTWGGTDTTLIFAKGHIIRNFLKKHFILPMWVREVKRFMAIGIANVVDEIELKKIFGEVTTFIMPYPARNNYVHTDYILSEPIDVERKSINVIIGHSGVPNDHHIQMIKHLEKWAQRNIELFIPMAYNGSQAYIDEVENYAKAHWKTENVHIIKKFMPIEQYCRFFDRMDIFIMDESKSGALGNIALAVRFKKKIFLNRNGVIREAFDLEHIPYCCIDELPTMSYDDFISPIQYPPSNQYGKTIASNSYQDSVREWQELFDWLDTQ